MLKAFLPVSITKISVTSPIVILNMPTKELLALKQRVNDLIIQLTNTM